MVCFSPLACEHGERRALFTVTGCGVLVPSAGLGEEPILHHCLLNEWNEAEGHEAERISFPVILPPAFIPSLLPCLVRKWG